MILAHESNFQFLEISNYATPNVNIVCCTDSSSVLELYNRAKKCQTNST